MDNKILRICRKPGCHNLTTEAYCSLHKRERRPDTRPNAYRRGYDSRWQKASKKYLISHPFCAECLRHGVHKAAEVVDHIKPHKGNKKLFWDVSNWQPLCKQCHDRKTASEDGGFGRAVKHRQ